MPELYRIKTESKPAFTKQILSVFCKGVDYGDPEDLANVLYGKYVVEDFSYSDDSNYWQVHGYLLNVVVPHKIEVFNAGAEIAEQPWFQSFIGESLDLWFDNLWLHDLSKFSANETFGYAFHDFKSKKYSPTFEAAWNHHKNHNEHHPEYWMNVGRNTNVELLRMPKIFIAEMVCDWIGAGKVYGSTLDQWLPKNLHKFVFSSNTKQDLQYLLGKIGVETIITDTGLDIASEVSVD